ncbi:unnamed protein product [Leptosia nina]|uniref:Cytochrome P450 n=1 Tax=Leptosia nina TaxID=320188 RepID=A0AAV1IV58_9NEOP
MMWYLVVAAVCILYVYWSFRMYPGNMPVYPGKLPLLGNLSLFLGDAVVITDPDDCNQVLSSYFERPGFANKFLRPFLGDGLLVGPGSIWKDRRKLISPSFNQQVIDSFLDIFNKQSRRLVKSWEEYVGDENFDHHDYLEKTALETVCLTMAGVDITQQREYNNRCLTAFRTLVDRVIERAKNPFYYTELIYSMSALKKTEDSNVAISHQLTDQVLQRKREEYNTDQKIIDPKSESKFKPFLHRLLDFSNTSLSDKDIKDEMNNIIFAGSQSSSAVVAYTLLLLGTYPEIQQKCRKQILDVFGDSDRDVSKADLTQLKYLDAVLKETMRLCPVAPFTGRIITEDTKLKNAVLRKGLVCGVMLYGVLNNPELWGSDVNEFVPERWLEPNRLPENPRAMGSFGYGKRNCIGKIYAIMTMKVSIVHILRRYRVTGNYHNMKLKNQVINKPARGHEIRIELLE